jgi:hypothetical protein
MYQNTPKSIVIVDRSHANGYRLRNALLKSEVTAHVFDAFAPALALIKSKKIDTVVVKFDTDKATVEFCNAVRELQIPVVYSSTPIEPHDLRQYGFDIMFPMLAYSPSMFVHYAPRKTG